MSPDAPAIILTLPAQSITLVVVPITMRVIDAALLGDAPGLMKLLHNGAQIDAVEMDASMEVTPLLKAVSARSVSAAQLLLQHGANIEARDRCVPCNVKDSAGYTALMLAVEFNDVPMVKLLLRHGAKINAKSDNGRSALMVLNGPLDSDPRSFDPTELIDTLVHAGIDINVQDPNGSTALDYFSSTVSYGNQSCVPFFQKALAALKRHGGKPGK